MIYLLASLKIRHDPSVHADPGRIFLHLQKQMSYLWVSTAHNRSYQDATTITKAERINIAITPPMFGGKICHSILHTSHTTNTTKQYLYKYVLYPKNITTTRTTKPRVISDTRDPDPFFTYIILQEILILISHQIGFTNSIGMMEI